MSETTWTWASRLAYPELAKRIIGKSSKAKAIQILEVEPVGRVWSAMIDEARTDADFVRTMSNSRLYRGWMDGKRLLIIAE